MNTTLGVDKLSQDLGCDLAAFTPFFKQRCGETPGLFRKFDRDREGSPSRAFLARKRIGAHPF